MSTEAPAPAAPTPPERPTAKKPPRTKLNDREQTFCDAYRGNKTQAAIEAGYSAKSAATIGVRLYKKVHVQAEIRRQQLERQSAAVMDRTEMQSLFSATARDTRIGLAVRLKAAELLGKTRGDFTTKVELHGDLHDLVLEAIGKPGE